MWGHALFVIPRLLFLLLLFIYFIFLSVRKKERKWRNGMKWNGGGDGVPVWEPRQACVSTVDSLCTWHTFPTCVTWFFPSFFFFSHFFFFKKKKLKRVAETHSSSNVLSERRRVSSTWHSLGICLVIMWDVAPLAWFGIWFGFIWVWIVECCRLGVIFVLLRAPGWVAGAFAFILWQEGVAWLRWLGMWLWNFTGVACFSLWPCDMAGFS